MGNKSKVKSIKGAKMLQKNPKSLRGVWVLGASIIRQGMNPAGFLSTPTPQVRWKTPGSFS